MTNPASSARSDETPPAPVEPAPAGWEWAILHTRPRAEKKARGECERAGYSVFLPLRRKEHRYGGRIRVFWSPLFPGYVFGCVPSDQVRGLKSSDYVANVLPVVAQAELVRQLQQIQRALEAGEYLDVMPYLAKGKPVRITSGPMKGVEGIVESVDRKTRVVISIEMIQQSVFMEIDSAAVELL